MNTNVVFFLIEFIAFLVGFFIIKKTLPIFARLGCKQLIRDDGPKSHYSKKNTPTMGGIYFIFMFIVYVSIAYACLPNAFADGNLLAISTLFLLFGFLGFVDDYNKVYEQAGLTMMPKFILQLLFTFIWAYFFMSQHVIHIPGVIDIPLNAWQSIFWGSLVILATVNAVNIVDGLDCLMIQVLLVNLVGFTFLAYAMDHAMGIFLANVFACMMLLNLFPFNRYPAKIFLGDTGSMAFGGLMAGLALIMKIEIPFIIMGIILVIDTLSVAIQITSFKLFRRRVFKMAPIHHGLELSGWHEQEVVSLFTIITIIGTLIGIFWVIG